MAARIGLTGGIGSGKSFVAALFAELGCLVISSDDLVRQAYDSPAVKAALRQAWGESVFQPDGAVDRQAIARRIFNSPTDRAWLERILHPIVAAARTQAMCHAASNPTVPAFVWDTPLLLETGLNRQCDAVVFIEASEEVREDRVRQTRGWDKAERNRREKLQLPLDRKREMSDYSVRSIADTDKVRDQVRDILSQVLAHV